jgi:hypothetical protein
MQRSHDRLRVATFWLIVLGGRESQPQGEAASRDGRVLGTMRSTQGEATVF